MATIALLVPLLLPMPWTTRMSGILHPGEESGVFASEAARIDTIHVADGGPVAPGQPLFTLNADHLAERLDAARSKVARLEDQAAAAAVNADLRSRLLVLQAELDTARAALQAVQVQIDAGRLKAESAGTLRLDDPDLRPGVWVARNERLGTLVDGGHWYVEAYVDERDLHRIATGAAGRFYLASHAASPVELVLERIDRDASKTLPEGSFAHAHGGSVMAREQDGKFIPEHAVYRIWLKAVDKPEQLAGSSWRGHVVLRGEWESLAGRAARAAMAVLWREAGW